MEPTLEGQTAAADAGSIDTAVPPPGVASPNAASQCAILTCLLLVLLALAPLRAFAAIPRLASPPEGERWFSILMDGERVGFGHLTIARSGDGYRIESEGGVKLRVMGFSREATSRETYLVGSDLALKSFSAESRIDNSPLSVTGEVTAKGIRTTVLSGGKKKERTVKAKGAVYPGPVLNIYPLMQGTAAGKSYRLDTLDVESVKVKRVQIEVVGGERLGSGIEAVHLRNDLYPMVTNDVWVDLKGNTLKESVRDDLVVTLAEDEATAKLYLADAALAKRDAVLDFSLIRVDPPIERPEQLKRLAVELTGIPATLPVPEGKGQRAARLPDGRVLFTMPNPGYAPPPGEGPTASDRAPSTRIPSDAPEIVAARDAILGSESDPARRVRLLVDWVSREIRGTVTDSQSPLETLKSRAGNCQSHARLYAALSRAAGIPTRFVSGLVYAPGQGFLYHSWAESYLSGEWLPVDPTFGEAPANPTHIKLVEGDSADEMGLLAGMIGRTKAKVTDKEY